MRVREEPATAAGESGALYDSCLSEGFSERGEAAGSEQGYHSPANPLLRSWATKGSWDSLEAGVAKERMLYSESSQLSQQALITSAPPGKSWANGSKVPLPSISCKSCFLSS